MRLGTYNVFGLQGFGEGPGRPDFAGETVWIEAFGRLDCDVLVLQEAGNDPERVGRIARGLGMEMDWLPSPGRWPGAILRDAALRASQKPISPCPSSRLPGSEIPFSRSAGILRLDLAGGETLRIASLHAHPSDARLREREADCLGERLVELAAPERPGSQSVVVMGDFNSEPGEPLHRMLVALGLTSVFQPGHAPRTHLKDRDRTAVDHIYLGAPLRSRLVEAQVVRAAGFGPDMTGGWSFSDHLPVVAEIAWPAPNPRGYPDDAPVEAPIRTRSGASARTNTRRTRRGPQPCETSSRPEFVRSSRRRISR